MSENRIIHILSLDCSVYLVLVYSFLIFLRLVLSEITFPCKDKDSHHFLGMFLLEKCNVIVCRSLVSPWWQLSCVFSLVCSFPFCHLHKNMFLLAGLFGILEDILMSLYSDFLLIHRTN